MTLGWANGHDGPMGNAALPNACSQSICLHTCSDGELIFLQRTRPAEEQLDTILRQPDLVWAVTSLRAQVDTSLFSASVSTDMLPCQAPWVYLGAPGVS